MRHSLFIALHFVIAPVLAHAQAKSLAQDYRIVWHNPNPEF